MSDKIYFKFEKFQYDSTLSFKSNLYGQRLGNFLNLENFRNSQVVELLFFNNQNLITPSDELVPVSIDDDVNNYIISTAVLYNPSDWTTCNSNGIHVEKKGIFDYLNPKYLSDLQQGKALLLIDQSVEGYQRPWLWKWFHLECKRFKISPDAIIYVTGNRACVDDYNAWCKDQNLKSPVLKVLPSTSLSMYIYQNHVSSNKTNFDKIIEHKSTNFISLYDCINLRPRHHRIVFFLKLLESGLLSRGKVSMPSIQQWLNDNSKSATSRLSQTLLSKAVELTPMQINHKSANDTEYHKFITRILDDVYLDTWVSLVTESTYYEIENSVFISEKTFKPIACMQPFIIVGSKHSLKYLRSLGYKTFSGFIDESYDEYDDDERFNAIIQTLNQIKKIPDKISWLNSMKEILEHNYKVFLDIGATPSNEYKEIVNYYKTYFKGK